MFGQVGHTEWDIQFQLLGFPVRIHPLFWLTAVFISWNPHEPSWVILGVLAVLISILVHELGHAWFSRRYGFHGGIVLWALGGLASTTRFSTWKNVKVSAAGPGAGFVLFGLTYLVFRLLLAKAPDVIAVGHPMSYFLGHMMFINLMWSLMNLVPVFPLDGGQITQSLVQRYRPRNAEMTLLKIYILSSGFVCAWSLYCMKSGANLIPIPNWMLPRVNVDAIQPAPRMTALMFGGLCAWNVKKYSDRQPQY